MTTFNYNSGSFSGSLDETDIKLWHNEFIGHSNMSGFIENIILNKNNQLFKRMQSEWVPKLINDSNISAISASRDDFINQVTTHSTYKTAYEKQVSGSL